MSDLATDSTVSTSKALVASLADEAFECMNQGELSEASEILRQAVVLGPQLTQLHAALGAVYYRMRDYPAALEAYNQALSLEPKNAELLKQLAFVHLENGQPAVAMALLQRADQLQPGDLQVKEMLLRCRQPAASIASSTSQVSDFRPIVEMMRRRPASVRGCISEDDAKFIHATIAQHRPDIVLEIGVASGASSAVILKSLELSSPRGALVSYDISPKCYYDNTLDVGYAVAEMNPENPLRFQLITGAGKLSVAKRAVSDFKRKLIFIDANHNPPFPALDLLQTLDLVAPGDVFVFHDINLPNAFPEFAYSCGAMELYEILPEPKWCSQDEKRNVGAYRFDGNYRALWQILSQYLLTHQIDQENLAALLWLARKARHA